MNVKTLLEAIVPDNIQNIPVVQKCLDVFTELLSNNARVADRIRNLFSVDPEIRRTVDDSGFVQVHEDSDYVKRCKAELKEGLFCTYLSVLWDAVKDTQYSVEVRNSIKQRGYFDNKLEQEIAEILDCEDMTVFSTRRRYLCAESFMRYMYRFGKYLESGEMTDDLETDHWQKFSFSVRYAGSLYCAFFNSFSKPSAHPAGWDLEYDTVLKLAFSDVFGVVFEYVFPRTIIRTHDETKIILFTQMSREEILEDLLRENNILRKEPFDYDYITVFATYPWIETEELTEEMLDPGYSANNQIIKLIIVKKEYQKAEIETDPFLQKIYFSDNSYITKDKTGVRYKPSGKNIPEFQFGITFKLDIGGAEDLIITADPEKTTLNFLYTDEIYFTDILDMSWKDGAFRLNPCPDNAFKVSGKSYAFYTGLDESRNIPLNSPDVRRILRITAKPEQFAYFSVYDDFGHIDVKTLIPEIQMNINKEYAFDLDCSGLRGNYMTFRYETTDYSYTFRFNLSNGFPIALRYEDKLIIEGTTGTKTEFIKKVFNLDTQKYSEKRIKLESLDFSFATVYRNTHAIPKSGKTSDNTPGRALSEMNSGLFGEITFKKGLMTMPNPVVPDQMSAYSSSDPKIEPKDLDCLCYIGKGFEKEVTDNDCCIRIDSEKYVTDEFSISNRGSTGKILMTDDGYLVTRDVKTAQRLNSGLGFVLTAG